MNSKVLIKEGRPLFWPWCAVMLTGVVSLIPPQHNVEWIGLLGFVLGVPLLAALPFGSEFDSRTLSLLMSQPVGRLKIWAAKSCIAVAAVASVILLFAFSPLVTGFLPNPAQRANAVALIVAVVASATFWTLIARSTIGGIALSVGTALLISGFSSLLTGIGANSLFFAVHFTMISVTPLLCYAGLMFWLGERTLARYQVTGTMAGSDLLTTGTNVMLGVFSNRARSNPSRPVLNLIHKELRLLRPVWLLTVLSGLAWTCFAYVELHQKKQVSALPLPVVAVGIASAAIVAILAGCLSLGEEKTSGTYAWHRTLPVSVARQWLIKFIVGLGVSLICAGVLPELLMLAGRHFYAAAFAMDDRQFQVFWLLSMLFITVLSFWCACAVNGTVSAVVWVAPILGFVALASEIGNQAGMRLDDLLVSKFGFFGNLHFDIVIASLGGGSNLLIYRIPGSTAPNWELMLIWGPVLILALIQSYRLFGKPISGSALSIVRKLLPLAILAFGFSLFVFGLPTLANEAAAHVFSPLFYTDGGIQHALSNSATRESAQPLQFTQEDLNKLYPFRGNSLLWLQGAKVTVIPDTVHPTTCCNAGRAWNPHTVWNYTAVIHLASGANLNFAMEPRQDNPAGIPWLTASVRWPNGKETIIRR
jgi:ABC-type transport system involved in multi-copper enzyme maturation permease subunit